MIKKHNYYTLLFFCIFLAVISIADSFAAKPPDNEKKILFISSYTLDTKYTFDNINQFIETYNKAGGTYQVIVENMNCMEFSPFEVWSKRFNELMDKHPDTALVILLGGEAWNCYLQQPEDLYKNTPVFCMMASKYGINRRAPHEDISTYTPKPIDLLKQMQNRNVKFCMAYEYGVKENIQLIKKLYPDTRHIVFLSDNTYNGIAQQTNVREQLKNEKIAVTYIDGRQVSLDEASKIYAQLPPHTVMLLGTWRIDKENIAYMNNSTVTFSNINPNIPVFSLTSSGIGYWAIGGNVPVYDNMGTAMGHKAYQILHNNDTTVELKTVPQEYRFDAPTLQKWNINTTVLPRGSVIINKQPSFFESYKYEVYIAIIVFSTLFIAFIVTLYFYYKIRTLSRQLQMSSEVLKQEKEQLQLSESALREAKEKAEEASRMKSAFISNISHEIRTPLNAIVGFSSMLVGTMNASKEQKEYCAIIETNSQLLLQLISDVLDISYLESGKQQFNYKKCEIISFCRNIVLATNQNKKKDIELQFQPFSPTYELYTDPLRLQQIITNLLNNALKFTPEGGHIRLAIEKDEKNERLLFSVTDTGCGIPEDKHNDVFERFEKLNIFAQGTGLGLPICRMVIQCLKGEIWIDKNYKKGSRFVFSHPITQ